MENIPSIVIVSSSNTKPKSLIKLLTKKTDINWTTENHSMIKHPWTIDTKYYTAEVFLVGLENDIKPTNEFNATVEALIIHMDTNKESGLEDLRKWESFEAACNLDIKLLVCNYCSEDTKIAKNIAMDWCLRKGFEFVELYPFDSDQDEGNDIKEKTGVERIIEALQSHTWSNLVLKNNDRLKPNMSKGMMCDKMLSNHLESANSALDDSFKTDMKDDFTELFSQLHMMKDSLQNMPMNQRKQCAEQMVTAFWRAIGGEEEELLDI